MIEKLPTNYADAEWEGLKKFELLNNSDGTISFRDVTAYSATENAFFGAKQANQIGEAYNGIVDKVNPSIQQLTLLADNWSEGVYSFEADYPNATYNIELEVDGDNLTPDQYEVWGNAMLVGSATSNRLKALGEVPTIDIPVVLKAVSK